MKIPYLDLKHEHALGRLPVSFGREREIQRLMRTVRRTQRHHAVVIGEAGTGRTNFLYGFAAVATNEPLFAKSSIVQADGRTLRNANLNHPNLPQYYQAAFGTLRNCVFLLDDFGPLISTASAAEQWQRIISPALVEPTVSMVLICTSREYDLLLQHAGQYAHNFEAIRLLPLPDNQVEPIIAHEITNLAGAQPEVHLVKKLMAHVKKFPILGNLPKAAIALADETLAEAKLKGPRSARHPLYQYIAGEGMSGALTVEAVDAIVSEKTGIPLSKLSGKDKEQLKNLEGHLKKNIIGQPRALATIRSVLTRARLGLRSGSRPLGSFLLLGPSGVGKTETGKVLASHLYGGNDSFLRLDMSEFSEAHAAQRLTGPPPGYVGSEDGGQLTNHFKNHPYSLLLLDEIEKGHSKVFDTFLQLLDDGRLTSGRGETVDFTQSVVLATSNIGIEEIITAFESGTDVQDPKFVTDQLFPLLTRHFRMEFLNRFDAILAYKPLSVEELTDIAEREIQKIETRTAEHRIRFSFAREDLERHIRGLHSDPRLGARPVKRFVETICENLISNALLHAQE